MSFHIRFLWVKVQDKSVRNLGLGIRLELNHHLPNNTLSHEWITCTVHSSVLINEANFSCLNNLGNLLHIQKYAFSYRASCIKTHPGPNILHLHQAYAASSYGMH